MDMLGDNESHYRILLVEDDAVDSQIVQRQLGQSRSPRFEIEAALCLSDALKAVNSNDFDAILLDLNLPDCNSMESVDQLKEVWTNGPIVVLTGFDEECHGIDAIRHGASDYLSKDGISATLLVRALTYAIERHRMMYWLQATEESKDDYLAEVCKDLKSSLSELLLATSVLVGKDEVIDPEEMQQIQTIMDRGKHMSELIDSANPCTAST